MNLSKRCAGNNFMLSQINGVQIRESRLYILRETSWHVNENYPNKEVLKVGKLT